MDCLRLLWPDFDKVMTDAGGMYAIFFSQRTYCLHDIHLFLSFGSAISQANISGIPVSNVDILRFLRPQPTTVHLRRPKFESSLQKLLVTHPTFSNIRVIDGTVRRIIRSEDGKSIASVIIRDLDNHSVTLDEVDMIAGEWLLISSNLATLYISISFRLHGKHSSRSQMASGC